MKLPRISIQTKLIALTLLIGVASSALIAGYALRNAQDEYLDDLRVRGRSITTILSQTLIGPIYQLRISEVSRLLAAVLQDPEVLAVYALDRDGQVLSNGRENESQLLVEQRLPELDPLLERLRADPAVDLRLDDHRLHVTRPVQSVDGAVLGFVHLRLTLEQVIASGRTARNHMLLIALAALALAAVFTVLLARHFSRRIQAILSGTRRIADGELEVCVPSAGQDELSELAAGINHMTEQLRVNHQELENLVEARTAELAEAKNVAEAASRAKSDFLASMSHELRTPLNAIMGFSQLFELDPELGPQAREQAREIHRAGTHLLGLVNDLIDLARIESGRIELSLEPVAVHALIGNSLTMMAPLASQREVTLSRQIEVPETAQVRADHTRARQVLINLLSNAIKYNHPRGTVMLRVQPRGAMVRLSVVDNGPGIPLKQQARIFTAFDRLGQERSKIEGSGIGLVITRRLVESMGGAIGFESTEGHGSTFWIELPVCEPLRMPAPDTLAAAAVAAAPAAATGDARRGVLYIEDNPMNTRLMQQVFQSRPELELRTAETAPQGLEQARQHPPALILMDINLPGMNGYEALLQLRADPRTARIPVIAVSANAMRGDREHGLRAGFDAYVTKPIDIKSFYETLDTVLGV